MLISELNGAEYHSRIQNQRLYYYTYCNIYLLVSYQTVVGFQLQNCWRVLTAHCSRSTTRQLGHFIRGQMLTDSPTCFIGVTENCLQHEVRALSNSPKLQVSLPDTTHLI